MKILIHYILKEFTKAFSLCLVGLLGVYYIVDIFDRIEIFVQYDAPLVQKFGYFLFKVPEVLYQVVPVSVLISIVVVLGIMTRNNEITAVKASGISLYILTLPLIFVCLLISLLVFFNNEYILPSTNRQATLLYREKIKGKPPRGIFRQSRVWYVGKDNSIYNVQILDPKQKVLEGVTLFRFDDQYRPVERIDAVKAYPHQGKVWIFEDALHRRFQESGNYISRVEIDKRLEISLPENIEDFYRYKKDPDEMNIRELRQYINNLKNSGFNAVPYKVDLMAKTAIPFITFIVAFLAIPLAVNAGRHGGIVSNVGLCMAIGLAYWLTLSVNLSLGHAGRLSPTMASWGANIIFGFTGLYFFANIKQ